MSRLQTGRRAGRRQRRLLGLALTAAACAALLFYALQFSPERWGDHGGQLKAASAQWRASLAFAYSALLFMGATLVIGPVNLWRNRPNPIHNPWRRDLGIIAAVLAFIHVSFGLFIHVEGWQIWRNWIVAMPTRANPLPLKYTKIGLANFIGLLQLGLIALLLLLSNNRALRRLGTRRWKTLQRLNYVAFGAVVAHGVLMQIGERRAWNLRAAFLLVVAVVVVVQLVGVGLWRRRARGRRPPAA